MGWPILKKLSKSLNPLAAANVFFDSERYSHIMVILEQPIFHEGSVFRVPRKLRWALLFLELSIALREDSTSGQD